LLDGLATRSCCTLAVQADGRSVETVESLGRVNNLSPLQRGFWEKHGLQCGYCTPGMLMLMTELLRENPNPDRETIRLRLNDNICRCTGYEDIVSSVERADGGSRQDSLAAGRPPAGAAGPKPQCHRHAHAA
jgi:carbon-monoxide dehydrogenase small subunit